MKQQEKGRGKLDIRVLFTLAAIAEILGTLLIATLLTALLENLLHEAIEVHPLVWLQALMASYEAIGFKRGRSVMIKLLQSASGCTAEPRHEAGCQREFRCPPDDEQRHQ